jgi:hypothetical protein
VLAASRHKYLFLLSCTAVPELSGLKAKDAKRIRDLHARLGSDLRRHDGAQSLHRYDVKDTADLDIVYGHIRHWLSQHDLNLDPQMPSELHGRRADNWRPLISIADACGPDWSARAREAAVTFARLNPDENVSITLLRHIREVFDADHVERISSKILIGSLLEHDDMWSGYRGIHGRETPRKLTPPNLAELLKPFGIRPRKFWPPHRNAMTKTYRGYSRSDFEASWRSYCDESGTPEHLRRTLHLAGPE